MKAVIMAGGEGSRLRPLTSNAPKPMMPVVNLPMMEHIVHLLRRHGFHDIVVTLAFMPEAIRTYFGDGSEFGVRMVYAVEESPLGTAGSVRNAAAQLDERFLVISGDVLTDVDLTRIVKTHVERGALATIGLTPVENPLEFGIVITREDGSIERFLEKPTWGQVFSDTINTGIFVLEPEIFRWIPEGEPSDFSGDVFPRLLEEGQPLYGAVVDGYWEDVGTLEAYTAAHRDVLDGKVDVTVPGFRVAEGTWVDEGAEVHPDAVIVPPVVIGPNCRIEAHVRLGPYTVLGSNVRVREGADLERTVVHDNAYLGSGVHLRGAVIGRSCDLRSGVRAEEGVVLGDHCFIGDGAVLGPGVKVYPFKTVEAGAIVNSSIVWESRGARSLFGSRGISGLANIDVTPELAARVAMAFATTLEKDAAVVTSRDSSRSARMLKRAMMAGLNACGVNALDLEAAPVPVTRFVTRTPRAQGGLTVRLVPGDDQQVSIRLFDDTGADISEAVQRKIERLYHREDFRRVFPSEIGDIGVPPRPLEHYAVALESAVDTGRIRRADFRLVVDYGSGTTAFVMPQVLSKLGAEVLAVNPYASTLGAIRFDRDRNAAAVAGLVRSSGGHLGAVIEPHGELITFVDDRGRVLDDTTALLVYLLAVAATTPGCRVALPVTVTSAAERIVEEAGGSVTWTKTGVPALMAAAAEGVDFAADGAGGFILPRFLPAFDAAAALVDLLDRLAATGERVSALVDRAPTVHMARAEVVVPWEHKGAVMRGLLEQAADLPTVLVDGVKVLQPDGWVLVLPDPDGPLVRVVAEGSAPEAARALAAEWARRIETMVG